MNRIQIRGNGLTQQSQKVSINGHEVPYVRSATYSTSVDEVSILRLETIGYPDIDAYARVELDISPNNLRSACKIIKDELLKHGDFYKAFVSSVQSAIREVPQECWSNELAEKIVKRISGEE